MSELNFDFGALHSVKVPRLHTCHFSLSNTTHTESKLGNEHFKLIRFDLIHLILSVLTRLALLTPDIKIKIAVDNQIDIQN